MSLINIKDNLIEGAIFYPSPNHDSRPKNIDISLIVVHAISLPPGKYGGNEIKDFFLNKLDITRNEYFKSIQSKKIKGQIITPTFKEFKNGEYKTIMVFAKKARGMMTRWIVSNEFKSIEQLKGFDLEGYEYNDKLSKETEFVFTRG